MQSPHVIRARRSVIGEEVASRGSWAWFIGRHGVWSFVWSFFSLGALSKVGERAVTLCPRRGVGGLREATRPVRAGDTSYPAHGPVAPSIRCATATSRCCRLGNHVLYVMSQTTGFAGVSLRSGALSVACISAATASTSRGVVSSGLVIVTSSLV